MNPIRQAIQQLRYPLLSLSFPLFNPSPRTFSSSSSSLKQQFKGTTSCTRFLIRQPSPAAFRECPTPLVFVRASGLGEEVEQDWSAWSGMFAEKGYTSVEIDITTSIPRSSSGGMIWPSPSDPDPTQSSSSSSSSSSLPSSSSTPGSTTSTPSDGNTNTAPSPLPSMVAHLNSQIRLMAIPFPPIIIASGLSCLVTQAYIEDNPASGLVLINPPSDSDPRPDVASKDDWQWPSFTYEPRFPILVLTDRANRSGESSANTSRIMEAASKGVRRGGKGVSVESLSDGVRGEKSRVIAERWMDSCGF